MNNIFSEYCKHINTLIKFPNPGYFSPFEEKCRGGYFIVGLALENIDN
jgi:hypothetical protein